MLVGWGRRLRGSGRGRGSRFDVALAMPIVLSVLLTLGGSEKKGGSGMVDGFGWVATPSFALVCLLVELAWFDLEGLSF